MTDARIGPTEKRLYEDEGYVVVPALYSREEAGAFIEEYERRWVELIHAGSIVQDPDKPLASLFPRMYNYDRDNDKVLELVLDPKLFDAVEALAGEEVLLIATSYYFKGPGMKGLPMHQDDLVFGIEPGTVYSAWISLDPADEENGCMVFVPKSHKLKLVEPDRDVSETLAVFSDDGRQIRVPDGYESVVVPTRPGDTIIFDGYSIHASLDNVSTDRFRRALLVQFAGVGTEKLLPNFNNLLNRKGERVRRRLNTNPNLVKNQNSVFSAKEGNYFGSWR
ncbi:phytanoyl-CoA dioxygenase family protein [Paenibacillus chitinolyticus]|uniref:phytanoyl-CoA dioxygenase family protein n=1 Tax=Paenibacillus chitinolyticus TaxID=79263 RepID=UPI002DB5ACFD|nr:phytanoyl-CoA dioxygenase family protein [Paenibacillus chitinolyticus]MEC0248513.1 phytanoyl-CoA dioxygenase family protein [Paenibacillus chitinolyticus]